MVCAAEHFCVRDLSAKPNTRKELLIEASFSLLLEDGACIKPAAPALAHSCGDAAADQRNTQSLAFVWKASRILALSVHVIARTQCNASCVALWPCRNLACSDSLHG